ncbi:alpha/beta fold hydrolase [Streptomyces sp. 1222.5]|uniref:alpha/beta fold hydrolase n=1 Tax=Streptomyces sp. 1222.5 TaxID=1881026 RepID=UPI003D7276CC
MAARARSTVGGRRRRTGRPAPDPLRTSLVHQDVRDEHPQGTATGDIATVSAPTPVGIGGLDVADFQDIARRYAAAIPGAALVGFPSAAHLIAMDAPTELLAALEPFLRREASRRGGSGAYR